MSGVQESESRRGCARVALPSGWAPEFLPPTKPFVAFKTPNDVGLLTARGESRADLAS